jgi:hypothetical protein
LPSFDSWQLPPCENEFIQRLAKQLLFSSGWQNWNTFSANDSFISSDGSQIIDGGRGCQKTVGRILVGQNYFTAFNRHFQIDGGFGERSPLKYIPY